MAVESFVASELKKLPRTHAYKFNFPSEEAWDLENRILKSLECSDMRERMVQLTSTVGFHAHLRYHDPSVCMLYLALSQTAEALDNHELARSYVLMAIHGTYHDWVLYQTAKSRELCLASILWAGSVWENRKHALGMVLVAGLSGPFKDPALRLLKAIGLESDTVGANTASLFGNALTYGPDAFGISIVRACRDVLHCPTCVLWTRTAPRFVFTEWILDTHTAQHSWPWHGQDARLHIVKALKCAQDMTALLRVLDLAYRTTRPYDPEVAMVWEAMAQHSTNQEFQEKSLREALFWRHRLHTCMIGSGTEAHVETKADLHRTVALLRRTRHDTNATADADANEACD